MFIVHFILKYSSFHMDFLTNHMFINIKGWLNIFDQKHREQLQYL
jgi:hypothetical protein